MITRRAFSEELINPLSQNSFFMKILTTGGARLDDFNKGGHVIFDSISHMDNLQTLGTDYKSNLDFYYKTTEALEKDVLEIVTCANSFPENQADHKDQILRALYIALAVIPMANRIDFDIPRILQKAVAIGNIDNMSQAEVETTSELLNFIFTGTGRGRDYIKVKYLNDDMVEHLSYKCDKLFDTTKNLLPHALKSGIEKALASAKTSASSRNSFEHANPAMVNSPRTSEIAIQHNIINPASSRPNNNDFITGLIIGAGGALLGSYILGNSIKEFFGDLTSTLYPNSAFLAYAGFGVLASCSIHNSKASSISKGLCFTALTALTCMYLFPNYMPEVLAEASNKIIEEIPNLAPTIGKLIWGATGLVTANVLQNNLFADLSR